MERLASRLDLKPDEAKRALGLGLILAGIISSYTLTKTVRDTYFLTTLPASYLPTVFIGVGIVSTVAALLFSRGTRRRATWESLAAAALVAAISLALFAQLFRLRSAWVPTAFYLWVNVYGLILVSQFWLFANSVSHPREARRTFSLIGLGGILGGLLGGLIAAPLAQLLTLPSLLNAAAILQVLVLLLVRVGSGKMTSEATVKESAATGASPVRHPYVRWLALAALSSVVVTGVLDYQFKVEIQRRYPTSAELASFLGLFYTGTNLAAIALQILGTRWMMQRIGATWAAAMLPLGLGVGAAFTIALPGFVSVTASRLWDQVARLSINKSATELFYFPLEPSLRRRAKAFIEAGLERLGDGVAGVLILVASFTVGASTRNLALAVAALLVVWVVAWLRIRRGYVSELGVNLRRMNLGVQQTRISLREAGLLKELERLLASPYERIVLQGIDMLEENDPGEIEKHLGALLTHTSPRVRARALRVVRSRRLQQFATRVESLIRDEAEEVRVEAMSTHCTLAGSDPIEPLLRFMDSPDSRVRRSAILCLTENAPCEVEGAVGDTLGRLLREGHRDDRVAVAEALGRRPPPCVLHDMLTPLLQDPDLEVRRAALRSAGRTQRRQHFSILIEALGRRSTEDAARIALASLSERVVGTLGDYLCDSTVPTEIRHAIPRALGEIHTQESVNALFRCREREDVRLSYRILKASNRMRAASAPVVFPRNLVDEDVDHDVRSHLYALVHYRACPVGRGRSAERMLCVVLNERMEQALNRIFRRLALLYPPQNILAAYHGATSDNARLRGNAIEYLENALAPDHRARVLPLVDDSGEEGRLSLAASAYGIRFKSYDQTLEELLRSDDPWLRACALYVVGERKERSMLPLVESNLHTLNSLVRETASWAQLAIVTG
jgi:AAA family ATP:ADP antiporter